MTEKEEFELIKDGCLSQGIRILLEDIRKHKESSDTIKVMPLIDPQTMSVISSQSDEMLKRAGYIGALEWIIGLIEHYQSEEYSQNIDDELE